LLRFPAQFFSCNFDTSGLVNDSLPKVFCGFLILLLCGFFFSCPHIAKKDKLFYGGLLSTLLFSFWINPLDLIWHGLNTPGGSPYRYSFVFSFLLLVTGIQAFSRISQAGHREICCCLLLTAIFSLSVFAFTELGHKYILLDFLIGLVFCGILLYLQHRQSLSVFAALILILIQLADLTHNAKISWNYLINENPLSTSGYKQYVEEMQATLDALDSDDHFYRMEIAANTRRNYNDSMLFRYNGLSHYSSTEKKFLEDWEAFIGVPAWNEAETPTLSADSLLGIKYIVSGSGYSKPYSLWHTTDSFKIYANGNALPLAMLASSELADITAKDSGNPFAGMNEIYKALSGLEGHDIFSPATYRIETSPGQLRLSVQVTEDYPLYAYFPAAAEITATASVLVNGEKIDSYYSLFNFTIVPLGTYRTGDLLQVELISDNGPLPQPEVFLYYENPEHLREHCSVIQSQPVVIDMPTASRISIRSGNVEKDQLLFLTIPYDKGWKAFLDGQPVEPVQVLDTFLAIPVNEACEIQLKFFPVGLKEGILISGITGVIILGIVIKRRKSSHLLFPK